MAEGVAAGTVDDDKSSGVGTHMAAVFIAAIVATAIVGVVTRKLAIAGFVEVDTETAVVVG